jgi:AraC-like DNA-binding protein
MTHSEDQARLITAKRPSLAERICEYIHNSDIDQFAILTEALLAEIFNIPREKLCKRFEKKLQKPLDAFLWEQRLFYVSTRISFRECNAINLPELSLKLGFPSYLEFFERFTKWLGVTPISYIELSESIAKKHQDKKMTDPYP